MNATYPGLDALSLFGAEYAHLSIPPFADVVKTFTTDDELNDYVTGSSYDDEVQIYGAIVWNSFGPEWDYTIRMNSSAIPTTQTFVNKLQRNVDTQFQNEVGLAWGHMAAHCMPSCDTHCAQYFGISVSQNELSALATQPNGLSQLAKKVIPGFIPIQIALDR